MITHFHLPHKGGLSPGDCLSISPSVPLGSRCRAPFCWHLICSWVCLPSRRLHSCICLSLWSWLFHFVSSSRRSLFLTLSQSLSCLGFFPPKSWPASQDSLSCYLKSFCSLTLISLEHLGLVMWQPLHMSWALCSPNLPFVYSLPAEGSKSPHHRSTGSFELPQISSSVCLFHPPPNLRSSHLSPASLSSQATLREAIDYSSGMSSRRFKNRPAFHSGRRCASAMCAHSNLANQVKGNFQVSSH